MKKIALSIPASCHEDWTKMSPEEKGKFCGTCQKTVIDFSVMSDRQIAQFFKKPPSSVCGRFHTDQLERPLEIPRKRIPWVRYFFQFTWPAFVLFFKSCGVKKSKQKEAISTTFEAFKKQNAYNNVALTNLGVVLSDIKYLSEEAPAQIAEKLPPGKALMGDTILVETAETIGTPMVTEIDTIKPIACEEPITIEKEKPMDTVHVSAGMSDRLSGMRLGGVSWVKVNKLTVYEEPMKMPEQELDQPIIYPNPVQKGSTLNLQLKATKKEMVLRLYTATGQEVFFQKVPASVSSPVKMSVPQNLSAGIYFLQVIRENEKAVTEKIVVF